METTKDPIFWMVYLQHGGAPTHRHITVEDAQQEAARLAENTGRTAYVLKAESRIEVTRTVTVTPLQDSLPDEAYLPNA